MSYCVYGIIDPRSDRIFYIGQTRDFTRRRAEHLEGTDSLSGLEVRQIRENGFVPLFVRLEMCATETAALMAEVFWIELMTSRGVRLANAQAFSGYEARGRERQRRSDRLSDMQTAKLKAIANGKPARDTKPWSNHDLARLSGMSRKGMSVAAMADALQRSMGAVRNQLKAIKPKIRPKRS